MTCHTWGYMGDDMSQYIGSCHSAWGLSYSNLYDETIGTINIVTETALSVSSVMCVLRVSVHVDP